MAFFAFGRFCRFVALTSLTPLPTASPGTLVNVRVSHMTHLQETRPGIYPVELKSLTRVAPVSMTPDSD